MQRIIQFQLVDFGIVVLTSNGELWFHQNAWNEHKLWEKLPCGLPDSCIKKQPHKLLVSLAREKITEIIKKHDGSCSISRIGHRWRGWNKLGKETQDNILKQLEAEGLIAITKSTANRNRGERALSLRE
jgi:hypothetical protein